MRASLAQSPDIVVERRLINYEPPGVDLTDAIGKGAGSGDPRHSNRRMWSSSTTSMCRASAPRVGRRSPSACSKGRA